MTLPRLLVEVATAVYAFVWIKYLRHEETVFDPEDVIILLLFALCAHLLA